MVCTEKKRTLRRTNIAMTSSDTLIKTLKLLDAQGRHDLADQVFDAMMEANPMLFEQTRTRLINAGNRNRRVNRSNARLHRSNGEGKTEMVHPSSNESQFGQVVEQAIQAAAAAYVAERVRSNYSRDNFTATMALNDRFRSIAGREPTHREVMATVDRARDLYTAHY